MNSDKQNSGFTLIELAIVIMVIGLVMTGVLAVMKVQMGGRDMSATKKNLHIAEVALKTYLAVNHAYPCPAPRDAKKGEKGYGRALENCVSPPAIATVSTGKPQKDGTVSASGREKAMVRIGVLPFRSLGMGDAEAVDGWGNLLQYAITESLTDPMQYDQDNGAIDVVAEDGQSRVTPPGTVQYIIFSTGPDGAGGIAAAGAGTGVACPKKKLQTENCNSDSVFMDAESRFADAERGSKVRAVDYDDRLVYMQYDPSVARAGGLLFFYRDGCPAQFSPVDVADKRVALIDLINQFLPGEHSASESRGRADEDKVLCYSPRYALSMMIEVEGQSREAAVSLCPPGWEGIGYKFFSEEGDNVYESGSVYRVCAR